MFNGTNLTLSSYVDQDIWESDKKARKQHTREKQEVSPFLAGDHKAARNRQDSIIKTNKKHRYHKESTKSTASERSVKQ